MSAILLTDTPEVVELKRKFRELDEREEVLKREFKANPLAGIELAEVRQRKNQIAVKVFNQ